MKLKYLGTAAADGFPAVFCNCKHCNAAREEGGRSFRTRSQVIIDGDLLIDLPPDTYAHVQRYGLRLDRVKYLLITHSHGDHFAAGELIYRGGYFAQNLEVSDLDMYCNAEVAGLLAKAEQYPPSHDHIHTHIVEPYKTYKLGEYEIIPLLTNHMKSEKALIYIIAKGGKTILYGNDTGYLLDEVFDFIKRKKIKFDLISLDCTQVEITPDNGDKGTHMGFNECYRVAARFKEQGSLNDGCRAIVTHFSHNGNPMRDRMEKLAARYGFSAAYDGMEVEI